MKTLIAALLTVSALLSASAFAGPTQPRPVPVPIRPKPGPAPAPAPAPHSTCENTDDGVQQNKLVLLAELKLGVAKLNSSNVKNYRKSFTGGVGGPSCFARMIVRGTVNLTYPDPDDASRTCYSTIVIGRTVLQGGASSSVTYGKQSVMCYTNA